jgi:hypothetical protein
MSGWVSNDWRPSSPADQSDATYFQEFVAQRSMLSNTAAAHCYRVQCQRQPCSLKARTLPLFRSLVTCCIPSVPEYTYTTVIYSRGLLVLTRFDVSSGPETLITFTYTRP